MRKSTLRLFNAIQITKNDKPSVVDENILSRTTRHGYVVDPRIKIDDELLEIIEDVVGISGEKANAAFHKSWSVIRDTPQEELWLQAIVHYLTTYGFEQLGIYRKDFVYIPHEKLDLPDVRENIPLVVIKAFTRHEILKKIIELGSSGIALKQETLDDIMVIVTNNKYRKDFVKKIENRELKALLLDHYGIVPDEPVEFLRHLIRKLTDESLLIKNDYLINKIKSANGKFLDELLKNAPDDLASIFFRFKPLFLALKSISKNKTFFNRLRKQANVLHKPVPEDYLNSITAKIAHKKTINENVLKRKLNKTTIFRKIRLAYALKFRENPADSIVYLIRNGAAWATEFQWAGGEIEPILDIVISSIVADLKKNIEGKIVYIPPNIHYALPATEKGMVGNIPNGTYVSMTEDMIAGIHWYNTEKRVDLDLSTISESGKVGWNSYYKDADENILFSGDMTDAPEPLGASELFYLKNNITEPVMMIVNYYNWSPGDEVEIKLFVAHEKPNSFGKNYMVDVNNIVLSTEMNMKKRQSSIGLISSIGNEIRFYFSNFNIGKSISSRNSEILTKARKFYTAKSINNIHFGEILTLAGAEVVNEKPEKTEFLDLSPVELDKTTFIKLLV